MDHVIRQQQRLAVRKKDDGYSFLDRFGRFFENWKSWHTAIFDMGEGRTMVKEHLIFALGGLYDKPNGIYIWEGEYRCFQRSNEVNAYSFIGDWREPTDDERKNLSAYEKIWDDFESIEQNSDLEPVACISEEVFDQLNVKEGFSDTVTETTSFERGIQFKRRGDIEQDPSYKQIIPYVVVTQGDKIFSAKRLEAQNEKRLVAEKSLGVGGHIPEFVHRRSGESLVEAGMRKELQEELFIKSGIPADVVGTVYDDSDEVGQVHVGVVYRVDVSEGQNVFVREKDKMKGSFQPFEQIKSDYDQYENWSQYVIDAIEGGALNL